MYDNTHANDFVRSSPIRKKEDHMALPEPPSPRRVGNDPDHAIPWGDRKPAAKTLTNTNKHTYNDYDSGVALGEVSEHFVEIEMKDYQKTSKDGVLFPRNSPRKPKPTGFPETDTNVELQSESKSSEKNHDASTRNSETNEETRGETDKNDFRSGRMSKRELFWAAVVFAVIVLLTLMITFTVISKQNRNGMFKNNANNNQGDKNGEGDDTVLVPTGSGQNLSPSTNGGNSGLIGTDQSRKISIREEWELVYSALRDNDVTRVLLKERGAGDEALPYDLYFYEDLVSGMVFSEEQRDWIAAPLQYDDDIDMEIGFGEMSMEGTIEGYGDKGSGNSNNKKRFYIARKLTPNQKATAWLLFHDDLNDPNESVWRWAMASIYFKMGGENWNFDNTENNWFTNATLCEWERLDRSSGCDKHKQPFGAPLLPVELDFDNTNMVGTIAIEFALLLLPTGSSTTASNINAATTTNTLVRSITLTDNRLNGTIPGAVFHHLMPSLGMLYLDNNQLTGTIPLELGGLGKEQYCYNRTTS